MKALTLPVVALKRSTLPAFDFIQRICSYLVWGLVVLIFLFFELTGLLPFTPWRTLSETGWDLDEHHPGIREKLSAFLFGLAVHIRYRDTLESSYSWGQKLVAILEADGE